MAPARLLDSRVGSPTVDGLFAGIGSRGAGTILELQVAGRAGVPSDAATASLNVTVTEADAPGSSPSIPAADRCRRRATSTTQPGDTIPNAVITQIGAGGKVCLFTYGATHLIADINGYFPTTQHVPCDGAGAVAGQSGRLADGRRSVRRDRPRGAGTILELQVAGRAGVPSDAATASLNVTVTEAAGPRFVTVYPCGQPVPTASNLNYAPGDTIPNAVITQIGAGGKVCLFTYGATQLIADINGYFPTTSTLTTRWRRRGCWTVGPVSDRRRSVRRDRLAWRRHGPELQVAGRAGVPADAATASLNVTVTEAQAPGFVTVYPCGQPCRRPATSTTPPATPSPTRSSPRSVPAARSACSPTAPPSSSPTSTATSPADHAVTARRSPRRPARRGRLRRSSTVRTSRISRVGGSSFGDDEEDRGTTASETSRLLIEPLGAVHDHDTPSDLSTGAAGVGLAVAGTIPALGGRQRGGAGVLPGQRRRAVVGRPFPPLVDDPDGILALPAGFSYTIASRAGSHRPVVRPGQDARLPRRHRCRRPPIGGATR